MSGGEYVMRDLSVYYCSQCGFYSYYQLPKNAICHRCDIAMTLIEMRYQDFMNLDYEQRDKLISNQIVSSSTPYIQKICKPAALHNQREIVGCLTQEVTRLEEENQKLNQTVSWMHQTIWSQLKRTRTLEREIQKLQNKLKKSS